MELKSKNERINSLETNLDYLNSKLNAANIAVDENVILKRNQKNMQNPAIDF